MENKTFLEKLKFGIGDGNLQYYLYNWKCPSMAPEKVSASWGPASVRDGVSSPGSPQGDEQAAGAGRCLFALQGSLGSCPRAATSSPCKHKGLPSHTPAPRPAAVRCKAALSNTSLVTPRAPLHHPQCVCTEGGPGEEHPSPQAHFMFALVQHQSGSGSLTPHTSALLASVQGGKVQRGDGELWL